MDEAQTRRKSLFLVSILLASVLFVSPSTGSATQVSTFTNNTSSISISSDGNNTSLALEIDLERNVTYQDASFVVDSSHASATPGSVYINNSQGNTIWSYSGLGYGDLSHQNSFQTGDTYDLVQLITALGCQLLFYFRRMLHCKQANSISHTRRILKHNMFMWDLFSKWKWVIQMVIPWLTHLSYRRRITRLEWVLDSPSLPVTSPR